MTAASAPDLTIVFSSPLMVNGVTTGSGRMFGVSQGDVHGADPGTTPQVVEIVDGTPHPYPDMAWSSWREGEEIGQRFVGVNSIRVGPDGTLWAVDRGTIGVGSPRVSGAPRLIGFDLATDQVSRIYDLETVTRPWSFVDDVRFHGDVAYLTDCGAPALIVLDLKTGSARRVLEGHPSVISQQPLRAEHRDLTYPSGSPVIIHVDQLEVSPDGDWLYFQPCSGVMSRIRTTVIDDPTTGEHALSDAVEPFAATPSTGGTAIAADGTIYVSDTNNNRILSVTSEGTIDVFLEDVRLAWIDAMWINDDGSLIMPAAQLNRGPGLNWGIDVTVPPCFVYSTPTSSGPSRS